MEKKLYFLTHLTHFDLSYPEELEVSNPVYSGDFVQIDGLYFQVTAVVHSEELPNRPVPNQTLLVSEVGKAPVRTIEAALEKVLVKEI